MRDPIYRADKNTAFLIGNGGQTFFVYTICYEEIYYPCMLIIVFSFLESLRLLLGWWGRWLE